MKASRRARRAVDRRIGRRQQTRRASSLAARVRELHAQGFGVLVISRKTGLSEPVVRLVIEDAQGDARVRGEGKP